MQLVELMKGRLYKVLLTPRAYQDLCGCSIRKDQDKCAKDGVVGRFEKSGKENRKKVIALFTRMKKYADTGELRVPDHLNVEGDGFLAFKSGQIRSYFWKAGSRIIVSHFCQKKKDKLDRKDKGVMFHHRKDFQESHSE